MTLDQLHQEYGKLMIQSEILNGRINEVKRQIAEEMSKPRELVQKKLAEKPAERVGNAIPLDTPKSDAK